MLVVGHPFVDVWAAVKPERLGLQRWPDVPRSIEWKKGICQQLGWPHRDQADIARAWQHILGRVSSYDDLDPALLGRVEELIDFVQLGLTCEDCGRSAAQRPALRVLAVRGEHDDAVDERPQRRRCRRSGRVTTICQTPVLVSPM